MLRELSLIGQALSDPIRLRILKLLARRDLCVCELVYLLPASQSRVSQNLALLKNAHLVSDRREGRWVHYALNRVAFEQALVDFHTFVSDANLNELPEMSVEAERWARMAVDNPRGVCQPEPVELARTVQDAGIVMAPGRNM